MAADQTNTFKVNDVLIEYGQAFEISKIEKGEDMNKRPTNILHYRSIYPTTNQKRIYCTIPETSMANVSTRRPISTKEAKAILKSLPKSAETTVDTTDMDMENVLKLNDVHQTSVMVKVYWQEKNDPDTNFSSSKETQYDMGLKQMGEELSVVLDKELEDMQVKILKLLEKK